MKGKKNEKWESFISNRTQQIVQFTKFSITAEETNIPIVFMTHFKSPMAKSFSHQPKSEQVAIKLKQIKTAQVH